MTAIAGHTQILQHRAAREQTLSARDRRALHIINEQAHRLSHLIGLMMDVSHVQIGQLTLTRQQMDVVVLIRRMVEDIQVLHDEHQITLGCPVDSLLIDGDMLRLEQVFQNLVQNAIKYSPAGSIVTVTVEQQETVASIAVSDQGIGIPQAAQAHLFQKFYRVPEHQHIKGLGVGLYVVKEIVTLHGGDIVGISREGQGSTFNVVLPLRSQDTLQRGAEAI